MKKVEIEGFWPEDSSLSFYHAGWEICEPGHSYGPAVRDHYLIHIVYRGKGIFQTKEESFQLHGGQAFLIVPNQLTVYTADRQEPWEYGWIGFRGGESEQIPEQLGFSRKCPVIPVHDTAQVQRCVQELALFSRERGNPFLIKAKVYELFSLLTKKEDIIANEEVVKAAEEYFRRNYSNTTCRITEAAKYLGVDRSQLFRLFKKYRGIAPQQCLLQIRMQQAEILLKSSSLTVTEILYSCGFSDACHFSRSFLKHTGLSPREYRRRYVQNKWDK